MEIASFQFECDQPDQTTEMLKPVSPGIELRKRRSGRFHAGAAGNALPGMGVFKIGLSHANVLSPGLQFYSLTPPLDGSVEVTAGRRSARVSPGVLHLQPAGREFDLRTAEMGSTLVVNLDASLLERHLRGAGSAETTAIPSQIELGGESGTSLVRYLEFLWSDLQTPNSAFRSSVVATEAAMLVAAMIADLVDDHAEPVPTGGPERDALRMAAEFLRANVDSPVALADVAEAAGVSVRTLSRTFKKHHGMGPIRFLTEMRLDVVRFVLLARSSEETRITRVALEHGFASPGRFAVQYRGRFGEMPSQTLARPPAVVAPRSSPDSVPRGS